MPQKHIIILFLLCVFYVCLKYCIAVILARAQLKRHLVISMGLTLNKNKSFSLFHCKIKSI